MKPAIFSKFQGWGGVSFIAGIVILLSLTILIPLPNLRGPQVIAFLTAYLVAAAAYFIAVIRLGRDKLPIGIIWVLAISFRALFLFTEQSLSDDVFRFIWDGNLLSQGINPYAQAVNSPLLNSYAIPIRALVNHDWMASPYLPAAQLLFLSVVGIAPESVFPFQITAVILDLLIGWLVFDSLRRLSISPAGALIYLWNPLVISEFSNGAHVIDAWMIFLVMLAFWFMIRASTSPHRENLFNLGVVLAMAGATLTKGLPVLLVPIFLRRWRWKWTLLYSGILLTALYAFALDAGWGIIGPLDGTGVFGAMRIYMSWWNFNSGIYHWLEVGLSGYPTPGAVPIEVVGQAPILIARSLTSFAIILISLITGYSAWCTDAPQRGDYLNRTLSLIRLSVIPLGGYLLFTHTIHPWYVIIILPFLPFLLPTRDEMTQVSRFMWPWLYLSVAVSLSYLTYIDANNFREYDFVRLLEYIPVFLLLTWATWPWLSQGFTLIFDRGIRGDRIKRR